MESEEQPDVLREAVGVFETADSLQEAIDELLMSGFNRAELSLLAAESAVDEKLGGKYQKIAELEDSSIAPRCCYVSKESLGTAQGGLISGLLYVGAITASVAIVASGGALAATIIGASLAGGVGGLIGTVLASLIDDHHASYLQEQLEHGGLLLWVRTWNKEREKCAAEILARHSARDVHIHTLSART